jgi:hypothetical protein
MEQAIGDNSLINTILASKISETPTKKVEEVELPEPLAEEVVEIKKEVPKPLPEIDYTEFEEAPAAVQLKEEEGDFISLPSPEQENPEHKTRQRKITARWSVRLYDKLQGLLAMYAYDRLNTPQNYITRKNELLLKVYDGKISEEERAELKEVNTIVDGFMSRRTTYHESVPMSQDLIEDINELVEDLMEISGKNINPIWILVGLLLIQPVINLVTAFSHKMQHNTKF